MFKKILLSLSLLMVGYHAFAQFSDAGPAGQSLPQKPAGPAKAFKTEISYGSKGVAPYTALLILDLKLRKEQHAQALTDSQLVHKYRLIQKGQIIFANCFIMVTEQFKPADLRSFGFLPGSNSGNIHTGLIPVSLIEAVAKQPTVTYVQIGEPAELQMDEARTATNVNQLHQGQVLNKAFKGSGVVVGIIDIGFDYTHPNFYDSTGASNYRIKRVWEQSATSGIPPASFNYGRELSTQSAILAAQRDRTNESHGTHVAGIAAGAGGYPNSVYAGVAPKSDLVLVSTNATTTGIMNGIEYIQSYAASVGKPCVINMSWGSHIGPHDGYSTFDLYCDTKGNQGNLLVGSAGNEGLDPLYIGKTFVGSDSIMYTFVKFPGSSLGTNGQTIIDIWGAPYQNYRVQVNIYNTNTNQFEDWTPYINANSNNSYSYTLQDNDFFTDNCYVTLATSTSAATGKRNVLISIDSEDQDDSYRWVLLEIRGVNTQVKMWNNNAEFTNNNRTFPFLTGSTSSTVGEIGGTGNSMISVGAYSTKTAWISANMSWGIAPFFTSDGAIAPFSSKGPTADGRTKPNITAPGNVIVSSVNRFHTAYNLTNTDVVNGVTNGTHTWWFATMQGTSMAAPMVTGILALWLERYPHLTPTLAVNLLKTTAITDSHTGTIPTAGSQTWGWGKVNASTGMTTLNSNIPQKHMWQPKVVKLCQGDTYTLTAPSGYGAYLWSNGANTQSIQVSNPGSFAVRYLATNGYFSPWSDTVQVNVYPLPASPTITQSGNQLTSSPSSFYQWLFNNTPIPAATQQTHIAQQAGYYAVKITNNNGCSSQSANTYVAPTGISELAGNAAFQLYPNPAADHVNIKFSKPAASAELSMWDAAGKVVFQTQLQDVPANHVSRIDLNNFAPGTYMIKVKLDDQLHSLPLLKLK